MSILNQKIKMPYTETDLVTLDTLTHIIELRRGTGELFNRMMDS